MNDTVERDTDRIGRREFLVKVILPIGACVTLILVGGKLFRAVLWQRAAGDLAFPLIIAIVLLQLVLLVPLTIKRLHDVGRSGWWVLGGLVLSNVLLDGFGMGGVDLLLLLILGFWPGDREANAYGPPPVLPSSGFGRWGVFVRSRAAVIWISAFFTGLVALGGLILAFGPRVPPKQAGSPLPPLATVEQKTEAESGEAWNAAQVERTRRWLVETRMPELFLHAPTTMQDFVSYMEQASRDYDRPDKPKSRRGLRFRCSAEAGKAVFPEKPQDDLPIIETLSPASVSFFDAVTNACRLTGCQYRISTRGVNICK